MLSDLSINSFNLTFACFMTETSQKISFPELRFLQFSDYSTVISSNLCKFYIIPLAFI